MGSSEFTKNKNKNCQLWRSPRATPHSMFRCQHATPRSTFIPAPAPIRLTYQRQPPTVKTSQSTVLTTTSADHGTDQFSLYSNHSVAIPHYSFTPQQRRYAKRGNRLTSTVTAPPETGCVPTVRTRPSTSTSNITNNRRRQQWTIRPLKKSRNMHGDDQI